MAIVLLSLPIQQSFLYYGCGGGLPTKCLRILVSTLATAYITDPLLDTIGLRGVSSLWILESPLNLGALHPVGYVYL